MIKSPQSRQAARHQLLPDGAPPTVKRRGTSRNAAPITVEAMIEAALSLIVEKGYDALTMRSLAAVLQTGPASLYAHVVNKADLDELLIGHLCNQIDLPEPDPAKWRDQAMDVCAQMREQMLRHPGISKATLAVAPANVDILRIGEGMFSLLLAGQIDPQSAAWTMDALFLYVNAYCLEQSIVNPNPGKDDRIWVVSRDEMIDRFAKLPDTFPNSKRYAMELTSGISHERFDFAVRLILNSASQ